MNDISINNNKTVVILINSRYLGILLSTESLLKPSLAKANLNVQFFTNLVLKKAVSDKQLLYLILAVLYPIVSYRIQFSFIPIGMCNKGLKLKSGLPYDFFSDTIHHPSFYVQSESKTASLVSFANSGGILDHLFSYRSHNLQVLYWYSVHLLNSLVCICVSTFDNFLAGMVSVFFDCNLCLGGSLANLFRFCSEILMFAVLGDIVFVNQLHDYHNAFRLSVAFLNGVGSFSTHPSVLGSVDPLNILEFSDFVSVDTSSLLVYMDESFSNLGTESCKAATAIFFEDIDLGLDISVSSLISSILVELQAIVLALECVLLSNSVHLFSDSQFVLDAYKSELDLVCSDFCNQCWVKYCYIVNIICNKNLRVSWHKVKGHFGISENKHTDAIAGTTSFSGWYFSSCLSEPFITADDSVIFDNSKYFEVGSGFKFLAGNLTLRLISFVHY
ncbi:hypothetical protein G9A89_007519 [Geosiphon pyriformis]|nr:hypothetical protein G9A89_007519 [Geosiphon pyriformis]